jgi:uncharacterized protein (TIGR03067 family)
MKRIWTSLALAMLAGSISGVGAQDQAAEAKLFQGNWDVVQLVEDGKVISAEMIRSVLPSGGKIEIVDNAIVFRSPTSNQLRAKTFAIDATRYPKTIDVSVGDARDGQGIYKFDGGRLVICAISPKDGARPDDFAAAAGTKRMLMVLERRKAGAAVAAAVVEKPQPAKPATPNSSSSDESLRKSLIGNWRYADSIGALIVNLRADGTYSSTREVRELRLFQTVFVNTPVSNGIWKANHGQLVLHITGANNPNRLNLTYPFTIRSVSPADFIFVDTLGGVSKATRI